MTQPWTPPPGWVPTPEGWVPPAAVVTPSEPVPFHRLYRTLRGYRWWRPLAVLPIAFVYFIVLSLMLGAVVFGIGIATGGLRIDTLEHFSADIGALAQIDAADPLSISFALASIAVMLPAVQLAMLTIGLRPTSVRHSVAFRLRWRWLFISLGPAAVILAFSFGLSILLPALLAGEWPGAPTTDAATFAVCALLIVVLTPLQAAAEEYVFRGMLPQVIGSWVRWFPVGAVISTLAFASLHAYDIWGLVDVFLFGFAASLVTWRTGGLEAGITYHSINNIASFLLLASGSFGTTVNQSETAGPIGPALSLVPMAVWVLWMSWLARRAGVARVGAWAPAPAPGSAQDSVVPAPQPPAAP